MSTTRPPLAVYDGRAAKVTLVAWGSDDDPRYSVSISIRLPGGQLTGGQTFTAQSFGEIRLKALDHLGDVGDLALGDVEKCLVLATKQLELPITLPDVPPPQRST
jgi:hypothetical protein